MNCKINELNIANAILNSALPFVEKYDVSSIVHRIQYLTYNICMYEYMYISSKGKVQRSFKYRSRNVHMYMSHRYVFK